MWDSSPGKQQPTTSCSFQMTFPTHSDKLSHEALHAVGSRILDVSQHCLKRVAHAFHFNWQSQHEKKQLRKEGSPETTKSHRKTQQELKRTTSSWPSTRRDDKLQVGSRAQEEEQQQQEEGSHQRSDLKQQQHHLLHSKANKTKQCNALTSFTSL